MAYLAFPLAVSTIALFAKIFEVKTNFIGVDSGCLNNIVFKIDIDFVLDKVDLSRLDVGFFAFGKAFGFRTPRASSCLSGYRSKAKHKKQGQEMIA